MGTGRHNYHKCCELAQNGKEISNDAIVVGVGGAAGCRIEMKLLYSAVQGEYHTVVVRGQLKRQLLHM